MKNVIVVTGASSGFGALAARELARRGDIVYASMRETTGRNASKVKAAAGRPADSTVAAQYENGPYKGLPEAMQKSLASLEPADADADAVGKVIADVVAMPFGKRPFRTTIDPSDDGAGIVNGVADRVRAELFRRIGVEDLLKPRMTPRS